MGRRLPGAWPSLSGAPVRHASASARAGFRGGHAALVLKTLYTGHRLLETGAFRSVHTPLRPAPRLRTSDTGLLTFVALALGAGLGLASANWATSGSYPLGSVRAGPWTAWPRVGSREVDPYARAVIARNADLPLAIGEGLALTALVDDSGQPLDSACICRVSGETPPARHWTLTVYDDAGRLIESPTGRSGFTSTEVLRDTGGGSTIVAAREAHPGNWLPLPAAGRVSLTLRLYDTPVSGGSTSLDRRQLPAIERVECLP